MSDTQNPSSARNPEPALRWIGPTLIKAMIYALVFWAVYAFVYTPIYYLMHRGDVTTATEQNANRQMQAWDDQSRRSGEMLQDAVIMQRRYEALLTRQEQQVQRMDAILDAWERQAHVDKQ